MGNQRALVSRRVVIDRAGKSHACQRSKKHPIAKGDARLKVPKGRGVDHYCVDCALAMVEDDIERLEALHAQLAAAKPRSAKLF